jgi:hypothetical protein
LRAMRPAKSKGEANACHRTEEKQGVLSHVASLLVGSAAPLSEQPATLVWLSGQTGHSRHFSGSIKAALRAPEHC